MVKFLVSVYWPELLFLAGQKDLVVLIWPSLIADGYFPGFLSVKHLWVFLLLKTVGWWIQAPCVSVWKVWTMLQCLHYWTFAWKTHCTGLNLHGKGLCSVVFAKNTQISVRSGQQVCVSMWTLGFGTAAEAVVSHRGARGIALLVWVLCQ